MEFDAWGLSVLEQVTAAIVTFAAASDLYARQGGSPATYRDLQHKLLLRSRESSYHLATARARTAIHQLRGELEQLSSALRALNVASDVTRKFVIGARRAIERCGVRASALLAQHAARSDWAEMTALVREAKRDLEPFAKLSNVKIMIRFSPEAPLIAEVIPSIFVCVIDELILALPGI
jgi:hypothetical protein